MTFHYEGKKYYGKTAVEIVMQLAGEARCFAKSNGGSSLYEFLNWSLKQLGDRLPPREMDISNRLSDEALARNYLLMRAEYQLGELTDEKLG